MIKHTMILPLLAITQLAWPDSRLVAECHAILDEAEYLYGELEKAENRANASSFFGLSTIPNISENARRQNEQDRDDVAEIRSEIRSLERIFIRYECEDALERR